MAAEEVAYSGKAKRPLDLHHPFDLTQINMLSKSTSYLSKKSPLSTFASDGRSYPF